MKDVFLLLQSLLQESEIVLARQRLRNLDVSLYLDHDTFTLGRVLRQGAQSRERRRPYLLRFAA